MEVDESSQEAPSFSSSSSSSSSTATHTTLKIDGANLGHVKAYIADLEDEVNRRCDLIRTQASEACMELRNSLTVELMKIPKAIRKMTVAEFQEKYGGDVLKAVQSVQANSVDQDVEEAIARAKAMGAARGAQGGTKRSRDLPNQSAPPCTPGRPRGGGGDAVPQTPSTVRAPRRGELLVSANGSPIAAEDTIIATVKKSKPNGHGIASNIALEVDDGNGNYLDLAAPSAIQSMDAEMRKTAVNKLKSLQDEVAALMAQLNS
jgi:hypothetical protein